MVIVITGPIASGKSTVAGELARKLAFMKVRVAVVDLDLVYDQLIANGSPPDLSTWTLARRNTATSANAYLEQGVAVVIADGSFNLPSDRATFRTYLQPGAGLVFVTLRVSFPEALRRAQADPSRGRSQDPEFLVSQFAARRDVLAALPATDIVIDTEWTTTQAAAARIARLVGPVEG